MSRLEAKLKMTEALLGTYDGSEPLSSHLRAFFSAHKSMGSRDRRECREWVYSWFRIGRNLEALPFAERLAAACFVCGAAEPASLELIGTKLGNRSVPESSAERLRLLQEKYSMFSIGKIFPDVESISPHIDLLQFLEALTVQPSVWIRVQAVNRETVIAELERAAIPWKASVISSEALSVPAATRLQELHSFEKGFFEIQDLSSQRTGSLYLASPGEKWWDACAASGGKSLLLLGLQSDVELFASDVRASSLLHLDERLRRSGQKKIRHAVADLNVEGSPFGSVLFDGIIADVPCTGSGTWGRTPEWLRYFRSETIAGTYQPLQRAIVKHAVRSLKPGKALIYSTCSVFTAENEDNVAWMQEELGLLPESQEYFEGSTHGADTLFAARMILPE